MLSLRDKLKAVKPNVKSASSAPRPTDCLIRETRFPLNVRLTVQDHTFRMMQGDESLPVSVNPEEILFLDTETTGLNGGVGTVAFLVGVGKITNHELLVTQYLMRDYNEEIHVLRHVKQHLDNCSMLVTYNGKSFDMPLLSSRFIMCGQRVPVDSIPHADILHTARRVFKARLGRCSLGDIEEKIFLEPRKDDLPGSLVPERYFEYLKKHDLSLLEDILKHNAQDIASLARLTFYLCALHENPLSAEHSQDIFSLGKVFEKRNLRDRARLCYRAAEGGKMSALCREHLADTYKKDCDPAAAAAVYRQMIQAGQGGVKPYIALSKLFEHKLSDIPRAAECARQGLMYLSNLMDSDRHQAEYDDLNRRCARLLKKQLSREKD